MTTLYKNPKYLERLCAWEKARDLYEGKPDVLKQKKYLWPHAFELKEKDPASQEIRAAREQRSKYQNLVKMILTIYSSFFFRKPPKPDTQALALLGDAADDIDGRGTSFATFCKRELLESLILTGDVNLLVEGFNVKARNRAEEIAQGIRPYFELLPTLSVVDWDEASTPDRIGKLSFLRNEYKLFQPRANETTAPVFKDMTASRRYENGLYVIQRYEKEETEAKQANTNPLESDNWKEVGEPIQTKLTEIPIARIVSDAWLDDVCDEAERAYNLRSNRDNILYYQGYQKIFAIGVLGDEERKAVSEYIISFLPEGGSMQVVEPVNLQFYNEAIDEAINSAFKVGLSQLRAMPSDSRAAQAADSMSEEKDTAFARVESAIEDLETCVNEALGYWAMFTGNKNYSGYVEFNRDIAPESWDETIAIFQAFEDQFKKVDIVTKEILKKAVKRLNLSDESTEAAYKAIDAADLKPQEMPINPMLGSPFGAKDNGQSKNEEERQKEEGQVEPQVD